MSEHLKNIIKKVIDMKCRDVMENNFNDMTEQEATEHKELHNKTIELEKKLQAILSDEQLKLFAEYSDAESNLSTINEEYMFNRGVKMGLNELSFIKDELGLGVIAL